MRPPPGLKRRSSTSLLFEFSAAYLISALRQRGKRNFLLETFSLDYGVNKIGGYVSQDFCFSVRPANAYFSHLVVRRLTEMQAQIILREVAGAATHFAELHQRAGFHGDSRANRGFVAFRYYQFEQHAVICAYGAI